MNLFDKAIVTIFIIFIIKIIFKKKDNIYVDTIIIHTINSTSVFLENSEQKKFYSSSVHFKNKEIL